MPMMRLCGVGGGACCRWTWLVAGMFVLARGKESQNEWAQNRINIQSYRLAGLLSISSTTGSHWGNA